jgi:hypothetical protein
MEELPFNSRDVIFCLSGNYHHEHNNTVIEPGAQLGVPIWLNNWRDRKRWSNRR